MRKILIAILTVIFAVGLYFAIRSGLTVFNFKIPSIARIQEENDLLDKNIENLNKQISIEFPKAQSELEDARKRVVQAKNDYSSLIVDNESQVLEIENKIKTYETEYLWNILGAYVKQDGVNISMDLSGASTSMNGKKMYDLSFTVLGSYVSICDFVAHLEKDSTLEFSIENFKIQPSESGNTSVLKATFVVKGISINISDNISSTTPSTTTNTKK